MAKKSVAIPKEIGLPPALDFNFLKAEGIKLAQKLSGEKWTDYNKHDPGVTILEQLVYALTDLGTRTELKIEDILASQYHAHLTRRDNENEYYTPFYKAHDIFSSNPIIRHDYRKLLIDRVTEINNVWMVELNHHNDPNSLKGLYLILIELSSKYERTPETDEDIKKRVIDQLHNHRNFGEMFEEVIILDRQEIFVRTRINLDKHANAEEIHARILFNLERVFTTPVSFFKLSTMFEKGFDASSIFAGPRLFNGFILDHDLKNKDNIFFNNDLISTIRNVEGVKSVQYFNLLEEKRDEETGSYQYIDNQDDLNDRLMPEAIVVKKGKVGALARKLFEDANNREFFTYFKDEVPVSLNQSEVDKYFDILQAGVQTNYLRHFQKENDLPIPEGKAVDIADYQSVQNQFPAIYGVGKGGILSVFPSEKKEHIKQLKGYLLLFEQIMADYLMQLTRFNELFAFDKKINQTYFSQFPQEVPGIYDIIPKSDDSEESHYSESTRSYRLEQEESLQQEQKERYEATIKDYLQGNKEEFYNRRDKFMDHLMARVGETDDFSFDKFKYYYSDKELEEKLLDNKINLLQSYPLISRNKSRTFNLSKTFWNDENCSMLERRVRIQLGIPIKITRVAQSVPSSVDLNQSDEITNLADIKDKYENHELHELASPLMGINHFEHLKSESEQSLLDNITIDATLFRRGIWENNLRVIKSSVTDHFLLLFKCRNDMSVAPTAQQMSDIASYFHNNDREEVFRLMLNYEGDPQYVIEFTKNRPGRFVPSVNAIWKVIGSSESEDDAFRTAHALRNNLIQWNKDSEGFYVIDNILFRNRSQKNTYSLLLTDTDQHLQFRLEQESTFENIQDDIVETIQQLRTCPIPIVRNTEGSEERFFVEAYMGSTKLGQSLKSFDNLQNAEVHRDALKNYFKNFTILDIQHPKKVQINKTFDSAGKAADYNFTLTVLCPGWTARFHDPEFQAQLKHLFRKLTPAHIAIDFQWLNHADMLEFEGLYSQWIELYQSYEDIDALNHSSAKMMQFLKKLD